MDFHIVQNFINQGRSVTYTFIATCKINTHFKKRMNLKEKEA